MFQFHTKLRLVLGDDSRHHLVGPGGWKRCTLTDAVTIDLQTAWGNHSLVTATRILMAAALEDPYNQRFQLVCEATIPVRAPLVTHDQLLAQNMSRIGNPGKVRAPPHASNDCYRSARCLDPYSIMRSPVVDLGPQPTSLVPVCDTGLPQDAEGSHASTACMCSLPSSGSYICTGYPVRHLLRACSACMQILLQPQLKKSAPAEQVSM